MSYIFDEYFFLPLFYMKIGTRQLDMVRTKDAIKNMKIKKIEVKQSIFPQLDTDFPSENFHYS